MRARVTVATSATPEIGMQIVEEDNVDLTVDTQGTNSDVDDEFLDFEADIGGHD